MKITFLGTGTSQGVPMLLSNDLVNFSTDSKDKRMRSSVVLEWKNFSCLIDCGADFRTQILANDIKSINAILFTHEHSDHIAGLDDIRPFCYKQGPMPIFAMKRVLDSLSKRYEYIFTEENRYPGAAAVKPTVVEDSLFELGGKSIEPIKVHHGNLPILGFRIDKLAYLTDVKTLDDSELDKLKNLDVLVINALRIEEHPTHLNLQEALNIVNILKPKQTYFTHISHKLGFHKKVSKELPENVFLAYDGLRVNI